MNYILIVDDDKDFLEVLEIIINTVTSLPIKIASSGNKAWDLIQEYGSPKLIVSDFMMPDGDGITLFKKVQILDPKIPFVVCSGNPADELLKIFPGCHRVIVKPQIMKSLREVIQEVTPREKVEDKFVSVPMGFLLKLGVVHVDGFIKLSADRYVKIHAKGDVFSFDDAERFHRKLLDHLYVSRSDALLVASDFEKFLVQKHFADQEDSDDHAVSRSVIEVTKAFAKSLGWGEETVSMALKTVEIITKSIKKDPAWVKLLENKKGSSLSSGHDSLLPILLCMVAQGIGWISNLTQQKLVMAALLHDFYVEDKVYDVIFQDENECAAYLKQPGYLMHPQQAAELSKSLKGLPSDVDNIILQHHERPDGSGFPKGLKSSQISALSAIFIICEELIIYSHSKTITAESLELFWASNPSFTQKDPFRKIISILRTNI